MSDTEAGISRRAILRAMGIGAAAPFLTAAAQVASALSAYEEPEWLEETWSSRSELERELQRTILPWVNRLINDYRPGWHTRGLNVDFVPEGDYFIEAIEKPARRMGFDVLVSEATPAERAARAAAIDLLPHMVHGIYDETTSRCLLPERLAKPHPSSAEPEREDLLVYLFRKGAEKMGEASEGLLGEEFATYGHLTSVLVHEGFHHAQFVNNQGATHIPAYRQRVMKELIGRHYYLTDAWEDAERQPEFQAMMKLIEGDAVVCADHARQFHNVRPPEPGFVPSVLGALFLLFSDEGREKMEQYVDGARRVLTGRLDRRDTAQMNRLYRNPHEAVRYFS